MSDGKGEGRLSQLPRTLAKLAHTGSVQNAKQSLERKQIKKKKFLVHKCNRTPDCKQKNNTDITSDLVLT